MNATLSNALAAAILVASSTMALAQPSAEPRLPVTTDLAAVAPALERYAQETLAGKLWKRSGLSVRDRSLVTVAALIARNQLAQLPSYFGLALDSGVKPSELSGVITHLPFTPAGRMR